MARLLGYDYDALLPLLTHGREKTIGNNTTAEMDEQNNILIRLHGHHIVTLLPDGTVLGRDCGWQTVTTKSRLNSFGGQVFTVDHQWFFVNGEWAAGQWNEWHV